VTLFNLIDPIKKQDGGWQDFGFKYLKNWDSWREFVKKICN
jgi:hypothetical protein